MNNQEPKNFIRENILKSIEAGKVKMRPKWHFVVRTALLIVGTILVVLTLLYLISFILFILRQTGVLFVPGFGIRGFHALLFAVPWLLVLISLLFIVLLQILVKKYSFGYGRPLLYSAIGIILLVFVGGFLVSKTSFHHGLFMQAEHHRLPIAGGFYREFGEQRPDNVTVGVITKINPEGYLISGRNNEMITVVVTPETQILPGTSFALQDRIVVLGDRVGTKVMADGISRITGEMPPPGDMPAPEER